MNRQHVREDVVVEPLGTRRASGRSGAWAWIGGMLRYPAILAAVLALALVGGAIGRTATPAAAFVTAALLCDGAQINTGGCVYLTQDTPDLRAFNYNGGTTDFNDRVSSAWADFGQIALYSDVNYAGRCQTINPSVAVPLAGSWVGDNQVSSVRMGPCRSTDATPPPFWALVAPSKQWTGNPAATGSGKYIGDVKVVAGGSSGVSCGAGFSKIGTDLNKGAGGAYVYLCVRYSSQRTFNTIYAVEGTSPNVRCKDSAHFQVPGNLNEGAGGRYIYFCVGTNPDTNPNYFEGNALENVKFMVIGGWVSGAQALDFAKIDCGISGGLSTLDTTDLNKGAGGDWIYTCPVYEINGFR